MEKTGLAARRAPGCNLNNKSTMRSKLTMASSGTRADLHRLRQGRKEWMQSWLQCFQTKRRRCGDLMKLIVWQALVGSLSSLHSRSLPSVLTSSPSNCSQKCQQPQTAATRILHQHEMQQPGVAAARSSNNHKLQNEQFSTTTS